MVSSSLTLAMKAGWVSWVKSLSLFSPTPHRLVVGRKIRGGRCVKYAYHLELFVKIIRQDMSKVKRRNIGRLNPSVEIKCESIIEKDFYLIFGVETKNPFSTASFRTSNIGSS
uniref:Uncharacterized protein n=1 Tax=Micrurus spixii TaxID=129469 RepID=A0A2D4NBI0_9SAUR